MKQLFAIISALYALQLCYASQSDEIVVVEDYFMERKDFYLRNSFEGLEDDEMFIPPKTKLGICVMTHCSPQVCLNIYKLYSKIVIS